MERMPRVEKRSTWEGLPAQARETEKRLSAACSTTSNQHSDFNSNSLKATLPIFVHNFIQELTLHATSCSQKHTAHLFVGLHPTADRTQRRPKQHGDMDRESPAWVQLQDIVLLPADAVAHSTCSAPLLFPVNCLRCALVQLGCHMHLLCLRPFFWFGLPNRGPREPYVETTTAWGHSGHNLPVLLVAASNPPNSPSSYLTGSVLSTKDPAAPTVLAICPLFHSHTSQRHALAHDLLQPCIETLFQGGLYSPQPDQP